MENELPTNYGVWARTELPQGRPNLVMGTGISIPPQAAPSSCQLDPAKLPRPSATVANRPFSAGRESLLGGPFSRVGRQNSGSAIRPDAVDAFLWTCREGPLTRSQFANLVGNERF